MKKTRVNLAKGYYTFRMMKLAFLTLNNNRFARRKINNTRKKKEEILTSEVFSSWSVFLSNQRVKKLKIQLAFNVYSKGKLKKTFKDFKIAIKEVKLLKIEPHN